MNLTKEDYERLNPYEDKLYTACYCQFVRIMNRNDMVVIDEVYKKVFHTDRGIIGGCSHCVYEGCKKLGKLYFEDKKAYEKAEKAQKEAVTDAIPEETVEKEEVKPTQPKKKPRKMSEYK